MNKCYSTDEENYNFNSFDEVIDDLVCSGNLEVGREYYEADAVPFLACNFVDRNLDYMLENLDQQIYEELGECWDTELTGVKFDNPIAYKELNDFLVEWIKNNTRLEKFYLVRNSVTKTITDKDVEYPRG